ncbi:ABC transporter permease [Bacillota bacterium LX-D]|nr:ABC transporter permease [Bacillota bacterium LX-D]
MKRNWLAYSYLGWMIVFTVVPLFLILYYSLTIQTGTGLRFTLEQYQRLYNPVYFKVLGLSIELALISTLICLLIGYPLAMILASKNLSKKNTLILLFVLPMWMNFLLRTYAWMTLLERNGLINTFIASLSLPKLHLMYNNTAVILGMVYNFLPFMVLPIYSVLTKIEPHIIEAAEDLGADNWIVFRRVLFPLSLPGVFSGITMVFLPAVTTFVISRLLGGGQFTLLGNLIEQQFLYVGDWNFGSAISIILMLLVLLGMSFTSRYEQEQKGGGLW